MVLRFIAKQSKHADFPTNQDRFLSFGTGLAISCLFLTIWLALYVFCISVLWLAGDYCLSFTRVARKPPCSYTLKLQKYSCWFTSNRSFHNAIFLYPAFGYKIKYAVTRFAFCVIYTLKFFPKGFFTSSLYKIEKAVKLK